MKFFKITKYKKRFRLAKGKIIIQPPKGNPVDPYILASAASPHLLVRAKYLFFATLDHYKKKNAYAGYVTVRSFFETCMALGYLAIQLNKKAKDNDLEGIWQLSHRILQGGKSFPSDQYLITSNKNRNPAINVYDYIDEVDNDLRKTKSSQSPRINPHREMYDTVLSEFGHPNHLGLNICSYLKRDSEGKLYEVINLSRSTGKGDSKNYLLYLNWGSLIFFHYWDRLNSFFEKLNINLPKL